MGLNWFYSVVLHAALLLIVALAIGNGESEAYFPFEESPDLQVKLVPKGPVIGFERTPDWYGRWRRKCPHRSLRRELPEIEEVVWQDERCTLCGHSWWDVRDAIWD
jgi:hypothetical protein